MTGTSAKSRNTVARTMHDIGLAAWFGGSLMGAVGLNTASAAVDDPAQRGRVANAGWAAWTPINAAAIGVHLVGAGLMLTANLDRVRHQQGVLASSVVKTGLTVAALGVTAWSGAAGAKVMAQGDVPVASGVDPQPGVTPDDVAAAQKQLKVLQWAVPASTAALLAVSALSGEQQRGDQQIVGRARRAADLMRSELHRLSPA
jgi:hypothetical protein